VGIRNYLRVVAWYWYVVLAGLLIGLVGAGVVSNRTPTTYASEVTMILAPAATADESAYQGALLATERAKSYAPLLTTEELAGGVVRQLGLDMYPVELVGETSVTLDPDTVLIKARVVDGSALRAQQIAAAMGVEFTRLVADLERAADPSTVPAVSVKVVQPATFSDTPVAPNVTLNLTLGAILGLLAGLGGALALNGLRMPVRSVRDVAEVTRSPLLGVVRTDPASEREPLAVATRPDSAQADAFRRICAGTTSSGMGSPGKVAAVISSGYGDGRTAIACNLAVALAQARRRVVLVDCDLRHPQVGGLFGFVRTHEDSPADHEAGVSDVLEGSIPLDSALRPWGNGFLDVLAAGRRPSHPGGLLASDQMQHLLKELARRYDVVLLDTPPILPVSDAVALARGADGVIVVIRYGRTGRRELHAVMETLEAVSAHVIGTILNRVPKWRTAAVVRSDPGAPRSTPPRSVGDGLRERFDAAGTTADPSTTRSTPSPRPRTLNSARSTAD
jgi:succinoglycan biosynthesis transport protein ExoP